MQERKLLVTMKDIQRYRILRTVIEKKLKASQAALMLKLSYVHISRLKKRVLNNGLEGLLRKHPPQPPNKKITEKDIAQIIKLRKEIYHDFNISHFMDKLHQLHQIRYSYESIRKILINKGIYAPKKRRIVHRRRRRMPKAGMLVQMDSSQHRWLEHIKEKWWLIAKIDDATNEVPYAKLFPKDTLFANMHVIRRFIERKGLFMSLYVDKASHFKTTRHGGLHYNLSPEQDGTQLEKALNELDITIIPANSPQAKGRIEVLFRLFQDRFIKEMRLAGIKNYKQANRFLLEKFLPWYNSRYAHDTAESMYRALPKDKNLDTIFCVKNERIVKFDNTIAVQGHIIQIPPSSAHLSFAKRKVDVCILEDKRILVLYKGVVICESKLSDNNKIRRQEKKVEEVLNLREYFTPERTKYVPPPSHPWRKPLFAKGRRQAAQKNLTFQTSKNLTS